MTPARFAGALGVVLPAVLVGAAACVTTTPPPDDGPQAAADASVAREASGESLPPVEDDGGALAPASPDGGDVSADAGREGGAGGDAGLGGLACNPLTGGGCPSGSVCVASAPRFPRQPEDPPTTLTVACVPQAQATRPAYELCDAAAHCAPGAVCSVLCWPLCDFYAGGTQDPREPAWRSPHPGCTIPGGGEVCVRSWAGLGRCDNVAILP